MLIEMSFLKRICVTASCVCVPAGTLYEFFSKLGITKLQFKPAYNPYTEPSMEVFCYHAGLQKWIEVGNSGVFRPEMLLPMGLPEDVNVIAWGLSLER
jgi:phenylalanyl-tRNA synthetase alpha chain